MSPSNNVRVVSQITGTGMCVPSKIITNDYFTSFLETSDQWIQDRTGIAQRRWAEANVSVSELAEPAARAAIANAGLQIDDIDAVIFATVTPDYIFPSSACMLQRRLGIKKGFAFDINAVCSGFVYALVTADSMIGSGQCRNVLVVGAELFSRIINPKDRSTCVLFGDGAGAVVLSRVDQDDVTTGPGASNLENRFTGGIVGDVSKQSGIYVSELRADGSYADLLCVPSGTAKQPSPESILAGEHFLTMAGKEVFKFAVRSLAEVSRNLLVKAGLSVEDIDFIASHQANKRILLAMAKDLAIPEDRVLMNVDRYGNTSAASIPILLAESVAQGKIKKGDLILVSAVGGGFTWGGVLLRW